MRTRCKQEERTKTGAILQSREEYEAGKASQFSPLTNRNMVVLFEANAKKIHNLTGLLLSG